MVLKRMSDAIADNDRIYALIRGSAVNQDGRSNGLTAPNGPAQQEVIERALQAVRDQPADVGLFEAHGTGTALGDPIEMNSIARTLARGRRAGQPCWVGSVKSNIGHLEAAAGVAGFLKAVLAVWHGQIPAHLHLRRLNPSLEMDPAQFPIPRETTPWPGAAKVKVAGISSFGFGGTNAHVVISEAPSSKRSSPCIGGAVLPLSARNEAALRVLADRWSHSLRENTNLPLADAASLAGAGRAHFSHRLAVMATSRQEAAERLAGFGVGGSHVGVRFAQVRLDKLPQAAFLMTGQGAQYVGMARELYHTSVLFRQTMDQCAESLAGQLETPLLDALFSDHPSGAALLDQTLYAQPALYSVGYALTQLWQSWGIRPRWLIGHSVGQYVAACVAGVFSWQDGLRVVAARARLMQGLPEGGGMVAVAADYSTVVKSIAGWPDKVAVAAINGPRSTVISGETQALNQAIEAFARQGLSTSRLAVSHAFHSPLVEPILEEFLQVVGGIRLSPPQIPLVSNLTGEFAGDEVTTPQYWRQHMRQPVRFEQGLRTLRAAGADCFLEIGPKPTLLALGQAVLPEEGLRWLPSLRRGRSDLAVLSESVGEMYVAGAEINWGAFYGGRPKESLPTYPFQRKKHWIASSTTLLTNRGEHPLLGQRFVSAGEEAVFESRISAQSPPVPG